MNVVELKRPVRQLRCSGIAAALEARLLEAQAVKLAPIDFLSRLVQDELLRRAARHRQEPCLCCSRRLLSSGPSD